MLERIPSGVNYYLTIDIDGFDPSIAPGTGTPSHGGFMYYEVLEMIQGLSKKGNVIGLDLVEVAPTYDPAGITAILAAQLLMKHLGSFSMSDPGVPMDDAVAYFGSQPANAAASASLEVLIENSGRGPRS